MTFFEREELLDRAEKFILSYGTFPVHPSVLIALADVVGISGYFVRAAIWIMIGEHVLRLTDDNMLALPGEV